MKPWSWRWIRGVILVTWVYGAGCMYTEQTKVAPQIVLDFKGETRHDASLLERPPQTVAILPFLNRTEHKEAFDIIRKSFHGHFSKLNYTAIPLFRVDEALRQAGLDTPEKVHEAPAQKLREILRADAVIQGAVTHYERFYVGVYSQVAVGAEVRMIDGKTGKELWWAKDVSRKHAGGITTTPVGLIFVAVSTALNMRNIELLRSSDDLFRNMIKTIPQPTIAQASRPPNISILVHDGLRRKDKYALKVGDEIRVAMEGDPRMRAFFRIGDFKKDIPMKEEEPGVYTGTYKILPGDNVEEALIVGTLLNDVGMSSDWADVMGLVTIDTRPPEIPQGLKAIGRDRWMEISWLKNTDKDIARYKIYRSDTPLTGFQEIGTTEWNRYQDQEVKPDTRYYYRVSAVDLAGNESKLSDPTEAMMIRPGPTSVRGVLSGETIWYAAASPYVIEDELIIAPKGVLRIEPGTVIRSKGPRIMVQGKLLAKGEEGNLIIFEPFSPQQEWPGIQFHNAQDPENVIEFAKIKGAAVGIFCISSSPSIIRSEIVNNHIGIRVQDSFSKPQIRGNVVASNIQNGIEILAMAEALVEGNEIRGNGKNGIWLHEARPRIIRNRIFRNGEMGISSFSSSSEIVHNSIHDNGRYGIFNSPEKEIPLKALENWWGTREVRKIVSQISGRVDYQRILDGPPPEGKPLDLPVLKSPLKGVIDKDAFVLLMHSPYIIEEEMILEKGATLFIEAGVTLRFNPGASIRVRNGGIDARGTPERFITFTANSASPAPGNYPAAVIFEAPTSVASFFHHSIFEFAQTGLEVAHGAPDLYGCAIRHNSQAGIRVANQAEPKISFSSFFQNAGTGGLVVQGTARPRLYRNNFFDNPFAIQSFSSIFIDARENWWGSDPPQESLFLGEINYKPWLKEPEGKAPQGRRP